MKILIIGDPHGEINKIKKIPLKGIDLVLLTGDVGNSNLAREIAFDSIERIRKGLPEKKFSLKKNKAAYLEMYISTIRILKYLKQFALVYMIYGNVEESDYEIKIRSKQIGMKLPLLGKRLKKIKKLKIINNKKINFSRIKIGGLKYFTETAWIKNFKPSEFKEEMLATKQSDKEIKKLLKKFGKLDILLYHQPPYGILDKVSAKFAPKSWQGKHAGSKLILEYIKKQQPRYVFCGHIHEAQGMKNIGKTKIYNLGQAGYKIINLY